MISDESLERYSRQIAVPGFDFDGQQALTQASVLLVGCGGLGCPTALYLAAAGVGTLRLVDDDCVALSNLPRQIAYPESALGSSKVIALKSEIAARNSSVIVDAVVTRFDDSSADQLLGGIDVVVDASDSWDTRSAIDRHTARLGLPWVMGGAVQMSGQNMVFDAQRKYGCYHCLAPEPDNALGSCAQLGILGPVVGAVAMTQTLDTLKLLTGCATPAFGVLRVRDFRVDDAAELALSHRADCPVCGQSSHT